MMFWCLPMTTSSDDTNGPGGEWPAKTGKLSLKLTLAWFMAACPSLETQALYRCSGFGTTMAVDVFSCVDPNMVSGATSLVISLNLRRLT